jgi:hypothetical protein
MEKNNVRIDDQATSKETPAPMQSGMKTKGGMKTKSVRYSGECIIWGT